MGDQKKNEAPAGRSGVLELAHRFGLKTLAALVGLAGLAVGIWFFWPRSPSQTVLPIPGENGGPTVEVFNATNVDGLARTITGKLRANGIDVVYYGSARDSTLDSTLIIVRRGDTTAAVAVRDVLGTGRVSVDRDSTRLVDITVLLHLDAAAVLGLHP